MNNIILLFNDYYQLYLNGLESNFIIESYINKSLSIIDKNNYIKQYQLKLIEHSQKNFDDNIFILEFSKEYLGYIEFTYTNDYEIDIIDKNELNLFISYLSILIYNCKYISRPTPINCSMFNEILNNISDGVIITDYNFKFLFVNSNFKIILNMLDYKDYLNLDLFTIFPILKSQLVQFGQFGQFGQFKFKNKKIYYELTIDTNKLNLKLIINTIIQNNILYHMITISSRKKDNTLNNISLLSHELRNPLQSINLANYLLQSKYLNDDNKKYLNIINKATYDMKKIINDVYDMTKLDSNDIVLNIENINIKELIEDIIFDFNEFISNDNITFNYEITDNVPIYFFTDSTRLKQIIMNLLSNSIKYSQINKKNTINFKIDFNGIDITFIIEDSGIGIKEEDIGNLFKYKSVTTNNNIIKCDSNGFGLYICNKLAQLLGGKIEIKSKYMIGTTFTLFHPLKLENNDIIFKKNIKEVNLNGNILIVDDNEHNAQLFKNMIDNFKYDDKINSNLNIDICLSGEICIEICKLKEYDLIFMDINMIGIDGITTSKLLRKNNYNGKIIAATGNYELNLDLDKAIFNDKIIKPFDNSTILDIFHKYL